MTRGLVRTLRRCGRVGRKPETGAEKGWRCDNGARRVVRSERLPPRRRGRAREAQVQHAPRAHLVAQVPQHRPRLASGELPHAAGGPDAVQAASDQRPAEAPQVRVQEEGAGRVPLRPAEHLAGVVDGEDVVGEGGEVEGVEAVAAAQIEHGDGFFGGGGDGGGCCLRMCVRKASRWEASVGARG